MKYIVVDFEMNPLGKEFKNEKKICRNEIIEIGAVVLDEQYNEIGHFMTLVKPQMNHKIEKRIQKLTGITTDRVQSAPYFAEAANMFFQWCLSIDDEVEIYQWSNSDYEQFMREVLLKGYEPTEEQKELLGKWRDFQKEYGEKLGFDYQLSLTNALMYAGMDFDGKAHDALYDARNTANLLMTVRTPELCRKALDIVIEALSPKPIGSSLGDLFDFSQLELSV